MCNKTAENEPLVSVIVPSYNHSRYIIECIESIVNQTYKNFELIVIDDGSTDNSKDVLEDLQLKYQFKLVFQQNKGVSSTLNRGIKEFATGKYITFCASDDYWSLDKLEKQVKFMEKNRFYPMCYGKIYFVNESSEKINKLDKYNSSLKSGNIFEEIILYKIHPPVNYLFRKEIYEEVGYYNEKIFAEDYDMNLKITSKYTIGFINEYLSYYRTIDISHKINALQKSLDSHLMTIERYKELPIYNIAKKTVYLRRFNTFSGLRGYKKKALIHFFKTISLFYRKSFILACIKLILQWKSVDVTK